jgi:hypothetical protein
VVWAYRIPIGKLTILEGDPGVAKSWLTMALGAATTTGGRLPNDDSTRTPNDVLVLTAEDDLGDTVRPRMEGLGGDIRRVYALTSIATTSEWNTSLRLRGISFMSRSSGRRGPSG